MLWKQLEQTMLGDRPQGRCSRSLSPDRRTTPQLGPTYILLLSPACSLELGMSSSWSPTFSFLLLISFMEGNVHLEMHHTDVVVMFQSRRRLRETEHSGWLAGPSRSVPGAGLMPFLGCSGYAGCDSPKLVRMGLEATTTQLRLVCTKRTLNRNHLLQLV